LEERDLAAAAASGDQRAFTVLVERHRRAIYATAYKIVLNEDDALDVAQNVLLRLVERIGQYDGRGTFRSWLAVVVSRESIDHLRRAGRRREAAVDQETLEAAPDERPSARRSNPRAAYEATERRERVEAAMADLSPQQRAIFALRFREDMPSDEIADRLGLPPKQVRSQLSRAIARLRQMLAE
jgi:RNA polymerase sigma-70 factor (ECF subfamily)